MTERFPAEHREAMRDKSIRSDAINTIPDNYTSKNLITRNVTRPRYLTNPNQIPSNPFRDFRYNGVSGSMSFRKVGRIQSVAKPMIVNHSLPINHLIPAVVGSDETRIANADLGGSWICLAGMEAIRSASDF